MARAVCRAALAGETHASRPTTSGRRAAALARLAGSAPPSPGKQAARMPGVVACRMNNTRLSSTRPETEAWTRS
ncbi:hypothetical protein [Nonomuraea rubra]|uniref:hypothetical protein n=1 Tax=Nonomuraea rubra TaxID=46180 RepID=UPI0031E8CEA5